MRHAFLITAYTDFNRLIQFADIYSRYADCYIHIDLKSKISKNTINTLKKYENVYVIQKYKINWGSYKHFMAFLELMKMARQSGKTYAYYHIISANTFMIKSPETFHAFFEERKGKNFLEVIPFKEQENRKDVEAWYQYYYAQHLYNKKGKFSYFWNNVEFYGKRVQKEILHIKRKCDYDYKGYLYCHLTDECVQYVIQYVKENPQYIENLKYCFVSEEFFFQNMIMNSPYKDSIVNDSLIYDIWTQDRGLPAFLNETDFEDLLKSEKLFARKFGESSNQLIERLCEHNNVTTESNTTNP